MNTVRCRLAGGDDTPRRLRGGHRFLGKRRLDDAVQRTVEATAEEPWQTLAPDRDRWAYLEGAFIGRVSPDMAAHAVPHTRHMLAESTLK